MNKTKIGLMAILTMAALNASAQESWHLIVHTYSHHFSERKSKKPWNEENFGLGVRRDFNEQWSAQAGFFKNSYDRWSTYAIADYQPLSYGPFQAGVFAGVRTNYSRPVLPAAGAVVRWQGEVFSATVRAAPKISGTSPGLVTLELGMRF